MRVFTQFHTAQEHEQFLQNLQKERELRIRISELARYRRNGLTRHEECAYFEQERVQHEEWKEKRSVSCIFNQSIIYILEIRSRKPFHVTNIADDFC
jgi:hypothetical protein